MADAIKLPNGDVFQLTVPYTAREANGVTVSKLNPSHVTKLNEDILGSCRHLMLLTGRSCRTARRHCGELVYFVITHDLNQFVMSSSRPSTRGTGRTRTSLFGLMSPHTSYRYSCATSFKVHLFMLHRVRALTYHI